MLEFLLLSDSFFTTVEISLYTEQKFTLNKREVRLQQIKKLTFVKIQFGQNKKFNYTSRVVQLHVRSRSSTLFFLGRNPTIKIVSISLGCISKPHS
jgi:hypothetical protein